MSGEKDVVGPGQLELPTEPIEVGATELDLFDTELTRWVFDRRRRRFLLLASDAPVDPTVFELPWERYGTVAVW